QRRCFLRTASVTYICSPHQTQSPGISIVDEFERAIPCFGIVETVSDPLLDGGTFQCAVINATALLRGQAAGDQCENRNGQPQPHSMSSACHDTSGLLR